MSCGKCTHLDNKRNRLKRGVHQRIWETHQSNKEAIHGKRNQDNIPVEPNQSVILRKLAERTYISVGIGRVCSTYSMLNQPRLHCVDEIVIEGGIGDEIQRFLGCSIVSMKGKF